MTEVTRRAIVALAAADETATDEERDRIAFALNGKARVYTIAEVAKMLGLSRPTVYDMVKKGELKRTSRGQISEYAVHQYLTSSPDESREAS